MNPPLPHPTRLAGTLRAHRRLRAFGAILALGLLGVWAWKASCEHAYRIAPLDTEAALVLFRPYAIDRVVEPPWTWTDLALGADTIVATLRADGLAADVRFQAATASWLGGPDASARAFDVALEAPPQRHGEAFVRATLRLAAALDEGARRQPPGAWVRQLTNLPTLAYQALFVALLLALLAGSRVVVTLPRRVSLALLGLFAGAFAVRLLGFPFVPLHANRHGLEALGALLGEPGLQSAFYGRESLALHDLLFRLLPQGLSSLAVLGATVGAATAVVAATLLYRNGAGPWAAGAAGLLVAASPLLARVSRSETELSWVLLFLGLALLGWTGAIRRGGRASLGVGFLAWVLLVHLHVVTLGFALLPLVLLWALAPSPLASARRLFPVIAAGLVLAVPHARYAWSAAVSGNGALVPAMLRVLASDHDLVVSPGAAPLVVTLLAALGVIVVIARAPRRAPALAAGAVMLLPFFAVDRAFTDALRYQSVPVLAAVLAAGLGFAALLERFGGAVARGLLVAGLCAGLAFEAVPIARDLQEPDAETSEARFLVDALPGLPPSARLVRAPRVAEPFLVNDFFPLFLARAAGRELEPTPVTSLHEGQPAVPGEVPLVVYRGLDVAALESVVATWPAERTAAARDALDRLRPERYCRRAVTLSERELVARPGPGGSPREFTPLHRGRARVAFEQWVPDPAACPARVADLTTL